MVVVNTLLKNINSIHLYYIYIYIFILIVFFVAVACVVPFGDAVALF